MKLDTPLPVNTKARPPLNVGDAFVSAGADLAKHVMVGQVFWQFGFGPEFPVQVVRIHPCGAVECVVVEGRE
jgi:hypothetical protein